jgi:hypothetical protein
LLYLLLSFCFQFEMGESKTQFLQTMKELYWFMVNQCGVLKNENNRREGLRP